MRVIRISRFDFRLTNHETRTVLGRDDAEELDAVTEDNVCEVPAFQIGLFRELGDSFATAQQSQIRTGDFDPPFWLIWVAIGLVLVTSLSGIK